MHILNSIRKDTNNIINTKEYCLKFEEQWNKIHPTR